MPLVLLFHSEKIPENVVVEVRDAVRRSLAEAFTFPEGALTPKDVRIIVQVQGRLSDTPWDLDVSVLSNDVAERRNLEKRMPPVAKAVKKILNSHKLQNATFGIWTTLHAPYDFQSRPDPSDLP